MQAPVIIVTADHQSEGNGRDDELFDKSAFTVSARRPKPRSYPPTATGIIGK